LVGRRLRDQAGRHALQRRPGGDQLDHLLLGLAHDVDAAARHRAHEPLAFELRHRLAHRRAADAEIARELAVVEPHLDRLLVDVERQDHALERRIGAVREGGGVLERRNRDPGFGLRRAAAGRKRSHSGYITSTKNAPARRLLYVIPASRKRSGAAAVDRSLPYATRPQAAAVPRIRVQAVWSRGRNSTMKPRPMIEPTSALEKNTPRPPPEASSDWRKASSALSPSTIARTIGASG